MTPQVPDKGPAPSGDRLHRLWTQADSPAVDPALVARTLAACRLEQQALALAAHWPALDPPAETRASLAAACALESTLARLGALWPAESADEQVQVLAGQAARLEASLESLERAWPRTGDLPTSTARLDRALANGHPGRESGRVLPFVLQAPGWLGALAAAAVITLALLRVPGPEPVPALEPLDLWTLADTESLRQDMDLVIEGETSTVLAELDAPEHLENLLDPDPELEALGEQIDLLAAEVEAF